MSSIIDQELLKSELLLAQEDKQLNGTLKDLIKVRRNFVNLLLMLYIWIAATFGFYLISFQMKYLPGNIFLNGIVSSTADVPMSVVGGLLYNRYGVSKTMPLFFTMALIGSLCLIFFGGYSNISDSLMVMLTKVGIATPLFLCYLTNSSIFPAIYAGTAFGVCNLGSKIIAIFAPMVAEVEKPIPMSIFAGVVSVAIVAASMIKTRPDRIKK